MSASSVTGLYNSGAGSADNGKNKGSARMTLGADHVLGPRVVAAGTVTASSNVATITFPQVLEGSKTNYVIMLTAFSSNAAATHNAHVTSSTDSSSLFSSFAIYSEGASDVVHWVVIKIA